MGSTGPPQPEQGRQRRHENAHAYPETDKHWNTRITETQPKSSDSRGQQKSAHEQPTQYELWCLSMHNETSICNNYIDEARPKNRLGKRRRYVICRHSYVHSDSLSVSGLLSGAAAVTAMAGAATGTRRPFTIDPLLNVRCWAA